MRTYGTANLENGRWLIQCEPHVMARLKRTFGRINAGRATSALLLSDTLDVCRDLAWFCERFPLEVTPADYLRDRAAEYERRSATITALYRGEIPPRPFTLALPPRPYQSIAAEAMLTRRSLLLADDVGLGKTASAIAALTDPSTRPALVVTLTHLPKQWERELQRFAPSLRTHIVKRGTPYPFIKHPRGQGQLFGDEWPDVLIINYHKLAGWQESLAGVVRSVIFDEVQELRGGLAHDTPQKWIAAKEIAERADYRIGLTATPIYNYGGEFFSVLSVLDPETLGTSSEFFTEWCGAGSGPKARISNPQAFGSYLRENGTMLRRTRADVGRELPPVSTALHHVECDEAKLGEIQGDAAKLARQLLTAGRGFERMQAAEELNVMLRQATGIAKAPYVASFVRLLVEAGEKVVLYGWHRAVYDVWIEELQPLRVAMYTGSESPTQKAAAVSAFVENRADVLIISLRAGAGLDGLQHACRTVVFGELDWSDGVHTQCTGRVARDGQKDPVVVYMLLADHGSDPIVADILGLKRAQIEPVLDPTQELAATHQLAPDHLKQLARGYLAQIGQHVEQETA